MSDDPLSRVRAICLAMPGVTEAPTHGAPTWFVNGRRSFAKFVDPAAHRLDEPSTALWAAAPDGARHELVAADPDRFFEPPFGGARWVGMRLGAGTDWREVAEILTDAYRQVAPRYLIDRLVDRRADRPVTGEFVTETLGYDGGRDVTVYRPPDPPEAVVFAADGRVTARWGEDLEAVDVPSTMVVGVHRPADETQRLHEYSPAFDPDRFAAHEEFFVGEVRRWVRSRFGVALPARRTAVLGVSAGGELALAAGLRHPEVYGAILCASPGAGYRPPAVLPEALPRTYLVAGTQEPFFRDNATTWAIALRDGGADVVLRERAGAHGGGFWRREFPLMVAWAFRR